jgi:hypothetical protein
VIFPPCERPFAEYRRTPKRPTEPRLSGVHLEEVEVGKTAHPPFEVAKGLDGMAKVFFDCRLPIRGFVGLKQSGFAAR